MVGGKENWRRIYHTACQERYFFMHMDLQSNPVKCYRNFTTLISVGENLISGSQSVESQPEPEPEPGHK